LSVQNTAIQTLGYSDENWRDEETSRKQAILFMNDFLGSWAEIRDYEARKRVLEANKGIELQMGHDNNENLAFLATADFQQTWQKLARVLPLIGLEIDDKDQTLGVYFIEYNGSESVGFFESLKFWKSTEDYGLPIDEGDYQLNLSAMGEQTAITLATKEGVELSAEILNKLYPYFSEHFGLNAIESDKLERKLRKDGAR
jgi:outer membrane protein assembly factor BamC